MSSKYSYIQKSEYYLLPNLRAYTPNRREAAVFSTEDAQKYATSFNTRVVPVDIKAHNAAIRNYIHELEKNLIENEDLTIRVSPFTALTVYTLSSLFKRRLEIEPECARILQAVNDYEDKVFAVVTKEQVEDAMLEKEIHQALNNIKE